MSFQNENELKIGASVKATINDKVVESKVINIGFNRVTLRSQKGNEASYSFNSEKFLKWFNQVELNHAVKSSGEKSADDLLKGLKIVTSGPTIKQRTTTPKEDKFKLAFGFKESGMTSFEVMVEQYTLGERKSRLGVLLSPMFFGGNGNQASAIIITALAHAKDLNHHSDAEWRAMIDNRNEENCNVTTFDNLDRVALTLFCNLILAYADSDMGNLAWEEAFATTLPKEEAEALFVGQLLCDGGINKYDLSCAGLTSNLLKENLGYYGLLIEGEEE
ncbi:hypothetical protein HpNP52_11710 [Helicobacter pylori]